MTSAPRRPWLPALAFTFALGGLFLAANLATASLSPTVWTDEVMFADPAVNLATGHGFTTTSWFQPGGTFFAGNVPLYPLVLSPWVALFGANPAAVRSLNYVLVLAATVLLSSALGRAGLVRTRLGRCLVALIFLCGDGVTFSYRSGRSDALGMLWVAGMAYALTLHGPRRRLMTLGVFGALLPWTGLQLIPYVALLSFGLLVARRRLAIVPLAAVACGILLGAGLLFLLYQFTDAWPEFTKAVDHLGGARQSLADRLKGVLRAPLVDPSSLLLLAALGLLAAFDVARGRSRTPAVVGLILGLLVPCSLAFAGKYPRYYTWMGFAPLASFLVIRLDRDEDRPGRWLLGCVVLIAAVACLIGLPARVAVICLEWRSRDYAPVRQFIVEHVQPGDRVLTEFEAYYPVKHIAAATFLPPYIGIWSGPGVEQVVSPIRGTERDPIDVLITKPATEQRVFQAMPGRWDLVGRYVAPPSPLPSGMVAGARPYELNVYRRKCD